LEHRSSDGASRETSVTLILGMRFFTGHLSDVDSGRITLKETGPARADSGKFDGVIKIDYNASTITLKGKLSDYDDSINAVFKCKEMRP
jgi:hypothetical protein